MEKTTMKCPICGGKKDKEYPNCFHCTLCGFEACNFSKDSISECINLIEKRLEYFYKKFLDQKIKLHHKK
jgi:hypothetical protein